MSFNNITPAWVILGDNAIQNYINGKITFDAAMDLLDELKVNQGMKDRLLAIQKGETNE